MREPPRRVLALLSLVALGVAARADDFWQKRPASAWSLEEALKIVQNSPWAREEVVVTPMVLVEQRPRGDTTSSSQAPRAEAVGGSPAETASRRGQNPETIPQTSRPAAPPGPVSFATASYLIRWESAQPVADAFARLKELEADASASFQSPVSRRPADRYVVTVKTTRPAAVGVDIFAHMTEQQLREAARLKTKRGVVPPLEAERSGVGAAEAIHFFFPRTYQNRPLLAAERDTVEFRFQRKSFKLRTKFRLDAQHLQ